MTTTHKIPQPSHAPVTLRIHALTHDGRGIASYDETHGDKAGKKIFVSHALPDETVKAQLVRTKKSFDEADATDIISPSPHRISPICPHFGVCGGCNLQHFDPDEQIAFKQSVLQNQLAKSQLVPDTWLPAIIGKRTAYRTKARLGVRYLPKTGRLIVGFRERASNFLTDIDTCPILDERLTSELIPLKQTLARLKGKGDITHLELAVGEMVDDLPCVAMIVRHVKPLNKADTAKLIGFGKQRHWQIFLQPKGTDSIHRIDDVNTALLPHSHTVPPTGGLFYRLPDFGLTLQSSPTDFT